MKPIDDATLLTILTVLLDIGIALVIIGLFGQLTVCRAIYGGLCG